MRVRWLPLLGFLILAGSIVPDRALAYCHRSANRAPREWQSKSWKGTSWQNKQWKNKSWSGKTWQVKDQRPKEWKSVQRIKAENPE